MSMSIGDFMVVLLTQKLPVVKIAQVDIFCLPGICNLAMIGMGRAEVKTSMMVLRTDSAMCFVS